MKLIVSIITCTSDCMYQQDGCCMLERANAVGKPSGDNRCVNYLPRNETTSSRAKTKSG